MTARELGLSSLAAVAMMLIAVLVLVSTMLGNESRSPATSDQPVVNVVRDETGWHTVEIER